tara:strand:+ start:270 stop:578 length:309 start_codon:yes stop_codon:yes gene_type:complete
MLITNNMSIENIDSAPDYIHKFLESNYEQLIEIYNKENQESNKEGILYCKCSLEDNKLELIYMEKKLFIETYNEDLWNNMQTDKKIVFIHDLDIDSSFIMYI